MKEELMSLFMVASFAIKYSGDIALMSILTYSGLFGLGLFRKFWDSRLYRTAVLLSIAGLLALACIGIYYALQPTA